MRTFIWFLLLVVPLEAAAEPGGAPWGSADPAASDTCASCHFDREPRRQTGRIMVAGDVPKAYKRATTYNFIVAIQAPDASKIGFLLEARSQDGANSSGEFIPFEEALEALGSEIRSTTPKAALEKGFAFWLVRWTAPKEGTAPIDFFLAANISNDDASPFGDQIEYLTFAIPPD